MNYIITKEKKYQFIMAFLLDQLIDKRDFSIKLPGNDIVLEDIFLRMTLEHMVKVENGCYKIAPNGQKFMDNFFQKFGEFLKFYDIFCAVNLSEGTFAFSTFFDFQNDDEWNEYLNQPTWDDVRVAVCEFKKIDPLEIVFMSFLSEGKIEQHENWQYNLLSDNIWSEIQEICNTAITSVDLIENGVLEDIVRQGSTIMMGILKKENENKLAALIEDEEIEIVTYTEEVVYLEEEIAYYEPYYYDPCYVSPCWAWYL